MCGIFGMSVGPNSSLSFDNKIKISKDLFKLSESRGKEASGIAVVKKDRIEVLKRPYPSTQLIREKNFSEKLLVTELPHFTFIGHSRLVTNGSSDTHENNQPVFSQNAVAIHNGIIVNVDELFSKHDALERKAQVDSEYLVSRFDSLVDKGGPENALDVIFDEIEGVASTAFLNSKTSKLFLASNNKSLYFIHDVGLQVFIFASETHILRSLCERVSKLKHLHESIRQVVPDEIIGYDFEKCELLENHSKIEFKNKDSLSSVDKFEIIDLGPSPVEPELFKAKQSYDSSLLLYPTAELFKQRRCTKCLLPQSFPLIHFDLQGICNFCHTYQQTIPRLLGAERLREDIAKFARPNKRLKPVVPISGGRDSCYALHYIKEELGLDPVAYTYDWGMVTDLARRNISRICGDLNVEHILVSADIKWKRKNIQKNVSAWLKQPDLGMVPLFMAGDKQFFYYAEKIRRQNDADCLVFGMNLLERTDFKTGFCGIEKNKSQEFLYRMEYFNQMKLLFYYASRFVQNPAYINSTLLDSFSAFFSFYLASHNHVLIYDYLPWNEDEIVDTLISKYAWETATDTNSTWRIGDGTASFYNYIYLIMAGFTESETFRSNQIREGLITRERGLALIEEENRPRFESIKWYLDTIGLEFNAVIQTINNAPRIWGTK